LPPVTLVALSVTINVPARSVAPTARQRRLVSLSCFDAVDPRGNCSILRP
jgi:hypothetical protein